MPIEMLRVIRSAQTVGAEDIRRGQGGHNEITGFKIARFRKNFELFTNASSIGVGAVLNQKQRPVVFAFRTLRSAKGNYTVTQRECLAVAWALKKFRTYLGSLPIKVITDPTALTRLTHDIEILFDEARRTTKAKHEKGEKYSHRRRHDVQITVKDWVLITTHSLSSATKKVVAKFKSKFEGPYRTTATDGSDVVQSGRQIFDDFFQYLWPYIGNNMANVVFQMVKRLWLIHIDQ
ncbi:hypothetical protein TNCV_1050771 [Trichonephila clavipes]|nr:hypothetical protein TNCV_1050771 [Trichonephila clavipes]